MLRYASFAFLRAKYSAIAGLLRRARIRSIYPIDRDGLVVPYDYGMGETRWITIRRQAFGLFVDAPPHRNVFRVPEPVRLAEFLLELLNDPDRPYHVDALLRMAQKHGLRGVDGCRFDQRRRSELNRMQRFAWRGLPIEQMTRVNERMRECVPTKGNALIPYPPRPFRTWELPEFSRDFPDSIKDRIEARMTLELLDALRRCVPPEESVLAYVHPQVGTSRFFPHRAVRDAHKIYWLVPFIDQFTGTSVVRTDYSAGIVNHIRHPRLTLFGSELIGEASRGVSFRQLHVVRNQP